MTTPQIASILTARMSSERLPSKVIADIQGKPLMIWIAKRLEKLPGQVIIATTDQPEDDVIYKIARDHNFPVYRGSKDDVVSRVDKAVKEYAPSADFVLRSLGDCPFIETDLVERAATVMHKTHSDAFLYHLAPDTFPIYGSREFPFSRRGWNQIVSGATNEEREHTDAYFHNHRDKFRIVFHEPPSSTYFRSTYRLEIDYAKDLELIRKISEHISMLASLKDIVRLLDANPLLASINQECIEKTGPLVSYVYSQRRKWMKAMIGQSVVLWDGTILNSPDSRSMPIFCGSGACFLGYGSDGVLYTKGGDRIIGNAFVNCSCGSGKYWKQPISKSY